MGESGQNRRDNSAIDAERRVSSMDRKQRRVSENRTKILEQSTIHRSEISEAEIDDTLADSFPASDPPFWNSGIEARRRA
jgi:hypothetical protein